MEMFDMPGHLIRRLNQISTQVFMKDTRSAGYDITPIQFAAMYVLEKTPLIDQAKIASLISYDRATIGGVIDRLEQKGFIIRSVSVKDRRARQVSLSAAGQKILESILPTVSLLQDKILPGLNKTEQEQFIMLAKKAAIQ